MDTAGRELAVVTGASTGIGYELARIVVEKGYDLVIAADEPEINKAAEEMRSAGAEVTAVEADLGTAEGVERLYAAIQSTGRAVDSRPRRRVSRSGAKRVEKGRRN